MPQVSPRSAWLAFPAAQVTLYQLEGFGVATRHANRLLEHQELRQAEYHFHLRRDGFTVHPLLGYFAKQSRSPEIVAADRYRIQAGVPSSGTPQVLPGREVHQHELLITLQTVRRS